MGQTIGEKIEACKDSDDSNIVSCTLGELRKLYNDANERTRVGISDDAIRAWMEQNGACLAVSYMLGRWLVDVSWCKVISYGDETGTHKETWSLTRSHADLSEAMKNAIGKAIEISQGTQ